MITVVRSGPLTTVQDLGRPGFAHLGVPRSGALDVPALVWANALVGNPPRAAALETTLLGCALRFAAPARVAITGAPAVVKIDGEPVDVPAGVVLEVPAGAVLDVGKAIRGLRSYVAVAGGVAVEPVLGSRSTDTLSGLGPSRLADGMVLPIGSLAADPAGRARGLAGRASAGREAEPTAGAAASVSGQGAAASVSGQGAAAPVSGQGANAEELTLGVRLGPRDDWFDAAELFRAAYRISPMSNRVGCRLGGAALTRTRDGELAPEPIVLGAIQVPADGQPLIFLADHPTTGGYPVIGVVDDVTPLAQARPGTMVRFCELD